MCLLAGSSLKWTFGNGLLQNVHQARALETRLGAHLGQLQPHCTFERFPGMWYLDILPWPCQVPVLKELLALNLYWSTLKQWAICFTA